MLESRSVTLSSLSPAAAIQVQITPRTGEVSIGDSKLFLCQGKNSLQLLRTSPAYAGRCAGRQTASSWSVDGKKKTLLFCHFAWKQSPHWPSLILPAELQTFCDSTSAFSLFFSLRGGAWPSPSPPTSCWSCLPTT